MNRLTITSAAVLLAVIGGTSTASAQRARDVEPLVYYTSFEAPAYLAGQLSGQDGWVASPLGIAKEAAWVKEKDSTSGLQAVRIDASVLGGGDAAWNRVIDYTTTLTRPIIDVQWDLKIEFAKSYSMIWEFMVYGQGSKPLASIMVLPAATGTVWYWAGGPPVLTDTHIAWNEWNTFAMRLDYVGGTADFLLNGFSLTPLGSRDTHISDLRPEGVFGGVGLRVLGPGSDAAVLDSISVRPNPVKCAANCDGSWVRPLLNANDFACFLNEFTVASGLPYKQQLTSYANFDGSVVDPVLNVNDFLAFLNAYARGCP